MIIPPPSAVPIELAVRFQRLVARECTQPPDNCNDTGTAVIVFAVITVFLFIVAFGAYGVRRVLRKRKRQLDGPGPPSSSGQPHVEEAKRTENGKSMGSSSGVGVGGGLQGSGGSGANPAMTTMTTTPRIEIAGHEDDGDDDGQDGDDKNDRGKSVEGEKGSSKLIELGGSGQVVEQGGLPRSESMSQRQFEKSPAT